jgi:NTE family protein
VAICLLSLPSATSLITSRSRGDSVSRRTAVGQRSAKLRTEKVPQHLQDSPEAQLLRPTTCHRVYNIIHLIYRAKNYEGH